MIDSHFRVSSTKNISIIDKTQCKKNFIQSFVIVRIRDSTLSLDESLGCSALSLDESLGSLQDSALSLDEYNPYYLIFQ